MRWTQVALKTNSADLRTAKSCGPDTPTLVSSFAEVSARRRWQKGPVTGESAEETVKTIARGMPGDFRCDRGDYARVLILFCMRGCGCFGRPAFPAPSDIRRERHSRQNSRELRGEIAKLCLHTAGCLKGENSRLGELSPPPSRSGFRRAARRSAAGPCWSRCARRSSRCRRPSPVPPRRCGGSSRPCRRA